MINVNPKIDALNVLLIMIESNENVTKEWVISKVIEVMKNKEPHKLLTGADYAKYMTRKTDVKYSRLQ